MPRRRRIHYPYACYHVMLRGNYRQTIFNCEDDYLIFYCLLEEATQKYNLNVHLFCLMSNHIHLLLEVDYIPLAKVMLYISSRFTAYGIIQRFAEQSLKKVRDSLNRDKSKPTVPSVPKVAANKRAENKDITALMQRLAYGYSGTELFKQIYLGGSVPTIRYKQTVALGIAIASQHQQVAHSEQGIDYAKGLQAIRNAWGKTTRFNDLIIRVLKSLKYRQFENDNNAEAPQTHHRKRTLSETNLSDDHEAPDADEPPRQRFKAI